MDDTTRAEQTLSRPSSATPSVVQDSHAPATRRDEVLLIDRSLYRGQVNQDGEPHGVGCVYAALGAHRYAGAFAAGKRDGLGVMTLPNAAMYAGEFASGSPCGYGVRQDPFGGRSIGQWEDGELHGVGVVVDADGVVSQGVFVHGELHTDGEWSAAQGHIHRALVAEQRALAAQELAREVEKQVLVEKITAIDGKTFENADDIAMFLAEEDAALQEVITRSRSEFVAVEDDAGKWKFQEAELKETQKKLRKEINDKREELQYIAKFVGIAEEREAQVHDAEHTLAMLQHQLHRLQQQLDSEASDARSATAEDDRIT